MALNIAHHLSIRLQQRSTMTDEWSFGHERPLIMAHRGDPNQAPENSLEAMRAALQIGADSLETDVRLTKDNQLVLFHDEGLKRTTGISGSVNQRTLAELRKLDLGHSYSLDGQTFPFRGKGFQIVTIEEAFEAFPDTKINIDMKDTNTAASEKLAKAIEEYNRHESVVIASFIPKQLERFRRILPDVATCAHPKEVRRFVIGLKLHAIRVFSSHLRFRAFQVPIKYGATQVVSPKFVREAHKRNIAVHVWTINDRHTMEWLMDIEVDGIFTDEPSLMRTVLNERGLP
jgi:glycerophosphoryl diester phosphodiesterase